jgi:hypothetical protein
MVIAIEFLSWSSRFSVTPSSLQAELQPHSQMTWTTKWRSWSRDFLLCRSAALPLLLAL